MRRIFLLTLGVFLSITLLHLPVPQAQEKADEPAVEESPAKAETPTKTEKETKPTAEKPVEKPAKAKSAPDQEVDQLEQDLNQLKDEVFQSKARGSLLQEFLSNTEVEIYFKNLAHSHFELVSALYLLDGNEIYKKDYASGTGIGEKEDTPIFTGATTPGRHEASVILVLKGKKTGGYTDKDYEYQVSDDFSFVAGRGETTSVTITAEDLGVISKDTNRKPSHLQKIIDVKVETKRLAKYRRTLERRRFGIQIESGLWIESYQTVSDRLNLTQQLNSGIPIGLRANWWILPYLGVEGYYTHGKWTASTGFNNEQVDVTMDWMGLNGKFRHRFGSSIYYPEFAIRAGYNILDMDLGGGQNIILARLSDSMKYVDLALEVKVPILWNFGFQGSGMYMPWVDIDEAPLTSGTGSNSSGYGFDAGLYYNVWRGLTVNATYKFLLFDHEFIGRGTRTNQANIQLNLVETRNYFQGALIGLKYEF